MIPEKVKQGGPIGEENIDSDAQFTMDALIANNKYRVALILK